MRQRPLPSCHLLSFEKESKQRKLQTFFSPYRLFQQQVFYQIFFSLSRTFSVPQEIQHKVLSAYSFFQERVSGDPYGNRTHVCGVRGRRLNRLTNGPCHASRPSQRHTAHHSAKNTFALRANCFFVCVVRCAPAPRRSALHYGAPSGIRTRDPLIKSQLLYQLS